ncbi:MAG: OsmC family protein [Hydrogenophaga sp.]
MSHGSHKYAIQVSWIGNRGTGTSSYAAYGRQHVISSGSKPDIAGSADPVFRGNADRWNPEDLMVAAASACHKLWYLHLCAEAGIAVLDYRDEAEGTMLDDADHGHFTEIVLRPRVRIRASDDLEKAHDLHHTAHKKCYIANSVNFPIKCEPRIELSQSRDASANADRRAT